MNFWTIPFCVEQNEHGTARQRPCDRVLNARSRSKHFFIASSDHVHALLSLGEFEKIMKVFRSCGLWNDQTRASDISLIMERDIVTKKRRPGADAVEDLKSLFDIFT